MQTVRRGVYVSRAKRKRRGEPRSRPQQAPEPRIDIIAHVLGEVTTRIRVHRLDAGVLTTPAAAPDIGTAELVYRLCRRDRTLNALHVVDLVPQRGTYVDGPRRQRGENLGEIKRHLRGVVAERVADARHESFIRPVGQVAALVAGE